MDHSADIIDNAATLSAQFLEAHLAAARAAAAGEPHPEFDGTHCIEPECGEEIPAARLGTGACRCIECQEIYEAWHRRKPINRPRGPEGGLGLWHRREE